MQVSDQSSLKILILLALVPAQNPTLNVNNLFWKFRWCRFTESPAVTVAVCWPQWTPLRGRPQPIWIVCHGKSVPELQQIFMDCIFGMIICVCYEYSGFALVTEDGTITKDGKGGRAPTTGNREPERCSEDRMQ